jgi:hypothetical protein
VSWDYKHGPPLTAEFTIFKFQLSPKSILSFFFSNPIGSWKKNSVGGIRMPDFKYTTEP